MVTEIADVRKANFVLLEGIGNTKLEQLKPVINAGVHPEFEELLKNDTKLKDLYEGNWEEYRFKSRSEAEESLVTLLCMNGFSDDEIKEIMPRCKIGKWQEKDKSYYDITIRKGREFAETYNVDNHQNGMVFEGGQGGSPTCHPPQLEGEPFLGEINPTERNNFEEGQGGQVSNGYNDIERVTIDFLHFPTSHLPHYHDLDNLMGLIGKEYAPIKKANYYSCVSWKYQKSKIQVGKIVTDARIHVMLRQMTGTGKDNTISANFKLAEKYKLKYGAPTSLHPEQLIGKVIPPKSNGDTDGYKEIDGYFDRDVVILNEDKNYIQSEDLRYNEIRSYIRNAKDIYKSASNRIEKKTVDIPSAHGIVKYPSCVIMQFGQPVVIPEARVDDGDIGRDLIPFVDFEEIDQSDLLKKRVLENFDCDSDKAAENFVAFLNSLSEVDEFKMEDAAKEKFADLSVLLYNYGMQYSEKVANYTQKKKTRFQNYFLKFSAIEAAINKRDVIIEGDVERAFVDYFEMLTLEFALIEKYLMLDRGKVWIGVKNEDRRCLEWLLERGATSCEESNVTVADYKVKIAEFCGLSKNGVKHRYKRHKDNRWIDSKQVGQHASKVWLLFKPAITRITNKEFVTTAYKTYRELVSKLSKGNTPHDHPETPDHPEKNNQNESINLKNNEKNIGSRVVTQMTPLSHPEDNIAKENIADLDEDGNTTEKRHKCVCGASFGTVEELRMHQANCDKFQDKQSKEARKRLEEERLLEGEEGDEVQALHSGTNGREEPVALAGRAHEN